MGSGGGGTIGGENGEEGNQTIMNLAKNRGIIPRTEMPGSGEEGYVDPDGIKGSYQS